MNCWNIKGLKVPGQFPHRPTLHTLYYFVFKILKDVGRNGRFTYFIIWFSFYILPMVTQLVGTGIRLEHHLIQGSFLSTASWFFLVKGRRRQCPDSSMNSVINPETEALEKRELTIHDDPASKRLSLAWNSCLLIASRHRHARQAAYQLYLQCYQVQTCWEENVQIGKHSADILTARGSQALAAL